MLWASVKIKVQKKAKKSKPWSAIPSNLNFFLLSKYKCNQNFTPDVSWIFSTFLEILGIKKPSVPEGSQIKFSKSDYLSK